MPRSRRRSTSSSRADDGEYLKVTEAVLRIFNRQEELRANRARARIKVLVDRIGMDAFREMVDEELRGDWVAERDFDLEPLLFLHDEEAGAPAVAGRPTRSLTATSASSSASRPRTRARSDRPASSTVEVRDPARRPHPGAVPRSRRRSCASYSGGYARTTVQQNLVLRWVRDEAVYDVWRRLRAARSRRRPGRARSTTSSPAPGPTAASLASPARWASTRRHPGAHRGHRDRRSADAPDPHQDERLPERLRPAPHRQHRLHRCVDQGRRRAPCRRTSRTSAGSFEGGEVRDGPAAQVAAAGQASSGGGRALDPLLRVGAHRRRGLQRIRRPRRSRRRFEALAADLTLPVEFCSTTINDFIDWNRTEPFQVMRGEGECAV